jgi:hypothetical protein
MNDEKLIWESYQKSILSENFLKNKTKVEDFLIWEPEGDLRIIVDKLNSLESKSDEFYRGMSIKEYDILINNGYVVSKGTGMTRRNAIGCYVSSNIHLASRFALMSYKELGDAVLIILDATKYPEAKPADEGNFIVAKITSESIKQTIHLKELLN